jgi:hypothetical protein
MFASYGLYIQVLSCKPSGTTLILGDTDMKSKTCWILAVVLGLVILFFLPSLLISRFWTGSYGGMMGGPGMMGDYGFVNPFGFLGMGLMGLMWLIPVGALVLLVIGAVWFFNGLNRPRNDPHVDRKCSNCNKAVDTDWTTCPYCGNTL